MHKIKKIFLMLVLIFIISELILQGTMFIYKIYYISKKPTKGFDNDTFRILCVGESTTYGWPIHGNGYPEQLEQLLNQNIHGRKFKVYNLGVNAITSREIARHFYKNIIDYKPHLTIILLGNNVNEPKRFYLSKDGRIINNILASVINRFYRLKTIKLFIFSCEILKGAINKTLQIERIYTDIYINYRIDTSWEWEEHRANLEYMISIALKNKCKVLICNYFFNSPANTFLRDFAAANNIAFCDNEKIFKEYVGISSDLISEDGWHPNLKGYSVMAKNLYDTIIKYNLHLRVNSN